jgi:A/G-specific adenine glycosylase
VARLPAPAGALPADVVGLRAALLAWFDGGGRALAFRVRREPDPWAVLVSEVMAQQTQVTRVDAKWRVFMDRFPTPADLAAAPLGDVIRAWSGLGYNRRAVDLQRAARAIVESGGAVPSDVPSLQALPGVGPYTARAVAAIAFGRAVGAVDVNVRRVLGRLTTGESAPVPARVVQTAADALVDPSRPGDWTHALMDLGATVCRPGRPACGACPIRAWCAFPGPARVAAPPPALEPARPIGPRRAVPFAATLRWLRGRIVERLCSEPPGTGVAFHGPLGLHPPEAVSAALASLVADGLVELDGLGAARLAGERA